MSACSFFVNYLWQFSFLDTLICLHVQCFNMFICKADLRRVATTHAASSLVGWASGGARSSFAAAANLKEGVDIINVVASYVCKSEFSEEQAFTVDFSCRLLRN